MHDHLCMSPLFSSGLSPRFVRSTDVIPELPYRLRCIQRWSCAPTEHAARLLPNDVCRILRAPQLDSASTAVATVDVPAQVHARGSRDK